MQVVKQRGYIQDLMILASSSKKIAVFFAC